MSASAAAVRLKTYRSPRTMIGRFVARRSMRSAVFWAFIFGIYVAQKTGAYASIYSTPAQRAKIAGSFNNNVGLNALLGQPHHIETVLGYSAWTTVGVVTIIGGIWAFLLATKYFRGEEEAGRAELLQAGQTTARGAALNTLAGLGSAFLLMYAITAVLFIFIGRIHSINFGTQNALFFSLAAVSDAAVFLMVGALASQLMPTRSRASSLAAAVFGVSFLVRAMADTTSLHWLLDVTPLGWVEKLQPLTDSQPFWLWPIFASVVIMAALTVWLAGRRDLGDSTIADKDSAPPHTALLNTPFMASVRITRATAISWLVGTVFVAVFYGLLTKAAAQAFNTLGGSLSQALERLTQTAHLAAAKLYLGIVFFILMALVMSYVASAVGRVREEEAQGYVDNFLVRPVSRLNWLTGRISIMAIMCVVLCGLGGLAAWTGQASQQTGVPFHSLLLAGINAIPPAIFTLGAGVLTLGLRPRLTALVAYGVIGWSFIITMVSSGANVNHWLLDTSVLHQVALAPATNPNWTTDLTMVVIGLALTLIGSLAFNRRDLQPE